MDNFEKYNKLHTEVMKRLEDGEITTEQAKVVNDLAFEKYIIEKATREKYRKNAFKKKYNYDPKEKTIIVNGEKFKVDLDTNKKTMDVKDIEGNVYTTIRQTSADILSEDNIIYLDNNFFKLKHPDRRDALLQHEVAHVKLHGTNPKSSNFDKSNVSEKVFSDLIDEMCKQAYAINNITDKEDQSNIKNAVIKFLEPRIKDYNDSNLNKLKQISRDKAYEIAKKYESKENSHTNAREIEADRQAANKTSESSLKKGVREAYKYASTDKSIKRQLGTVSQDKTEKNIENVKKAINTTGQEDYKTRSKALKDEDLRKSKVYK